MQFDFSHIHVPFRMQPGLQRIAAPSVRLTPLDPAGPLYSEKRGVFDAGQSRHSVPGFDAAPALAAIAARGSLSATDAGAPELAFEEDFAVLDGKTGTLPWLCVCVPSHWAPEDKVGLDFAAVHRPVADNAALIAPSQQLVSLVTGGDCWERYVWTVSPAGRYDQHPRRQPRQPWPVTADADEFAHQCWLRTERQTFFPVGHGTRQAVFAIRVMLQPLHQAVVAPPQARRLHDSLESMSQAVLDYKGIAPAHQRLLRWLQSRT